MIAFLGSEIGRGHPFYLDGVRRALRLAGREELVRRETDVFRASRGLSRLAWKSVRASYRIAGRGGAIAHLYHRLRGSVDYDQPSILLRTLGRDLVHWARGDDVLVVDHPAVVGALGGRADVWYIHGEMVAPPEAMVRSAARIFVPFEETAGEFVRGGVHPERVIVTGVCVENELVPGALPGIEARRERISGSGPLTVGFFSSGAEPAAHVATLAAGVRGLAAEGTHRAVVFASRGGRLAASVSGTGAEVVFFDNREHLDQVTAGRFDSLDLVVSPPHERSNWAVALGVPFFLVGPDIGPFAPRNRDFLLRRGVAAELLAPADAAELPSRIAADRRDGTLVRRAESGTGVPFRGFERAAAALAQEADRRRDGGAA